MWCNVVCVVYVVYMVHVMVVVVVHVIYISAHHDQLLLTTSLQGKGI